MTKSGRSRHVLRKRGKTARAGNLPRNRHAEGRPGVWKFVGTDDILSPRCYPERVSRSPEERRGRIWFPRLRDPSLRSEPALERSEGMTARTFLKGAHRRSYLQMSGVVADVIIEYALATGRKRTTLMVQLNRMFSKNMITLQDGRYVSLCPAFGRETACRAG